VQDAKEQHFEVDERQKIAAACKTGEKEDQAGHLQVGSMVRQCGDVDRNCRTSKGASAGNDADVAREGRRRLKQAGIARESVRNNFAAG
jgi:hypothetical protein